MKIEHRTKNDILNEAISIDRRNAAGEPEMNFNGIAVMWSLILGITVSAHQVALCMVALKFVRTITGYGGRDSYVDLANYTALAWELLNE